MIVCLPIHQGIKENNIHIHFIENRLSHSKVGKLTKTRTSKEFMVIFDQDVVFLVSVANMCIYANRNHQHSDYVLLFLLTLRRRFLPSRTVVLSTHFIVHSTCVLQNFDLNLVNVHHSSRNDVNKMKRNKFKYVI
jgi:hypothetical protein